MYLVNADKDLYIGNSRASTTTNNKYFRGHLDELRLFKNLARLLKNAVRDEYLYRKALELDLNKSLAAQKDYGLWKRYLLYRKGVSTFIANVDPDNRQKVLTAWLNSLRKDAEIRVNNQLLNSVNYTGIQMLTFWNDNSSLQLAVPPLIDFRNIESE